jgi:dTDP-L-rhamnose 4-epimerase
VAAANAVALDAVSSRAPGTFRAFNTGSGVPHTVGEMAVALADAFGGPAPVVTGEFRLGDVRHITASSARLRDELGWRPAVEFRSGVEEFARAGLRGQALEAARQEASRPAAEWTGTEPIEAEPTGTVR